MSDEKKKQLIKKGKWRKEKRNRKRQIETALKVQI